MTTIRLPMYNMPLTFEKHFENLVNDYPDVKELHGLWLLLKKRIKDKLTYSRNVFFNYSLHDGSHSRSVLQVIERFLGDDRIRQLSATDTFMLLVCTYAHDYGMAQTFNKIYDLLGSSRFKEFLDNMDKRHENLEKEDAWAIRNLLLYLNEQKQSLPLNDMYLSIMLTLQAYLRDRHWEGVIEIEEELYGLFHGNVKERFIHGVDGIIEICKCHGMSVESLLKLPSRADGMVGDDFHPSFVAAMLRFGDLLDLDNGRFPLWFVNEIAQHRNLIPKLSVIHFHKHEAISHILITPKQIEITARCSSKEDGYEVASLIAEWREWLMAECREMVIHWNQITQPDFGRPPAHIVVDIFVDGRRYMAEDKKLQMQMPQERVMKLLEGTSIYRDKYVGIREMIQNAVDASLLQLWTDIIHNQYVSYGLSKNEAISDQAENKLDLLDLLEGKRSDIFGNYDITVEVILDKEAEKVLVVVKDKGTGITPADMEYISNIGSTKEKNIRAQKIMKTMPDWLKPSGVFGIGLQSVFQLTDCIEFYTRQHNSPELLISLYSYGRNKGKIEIQEVPPHEVGVYNDNAIPGTNVLLVIEPRFFFGRDGSIEKDRFVYYDLEFDKGEELDMLYAEIAHACEHIIKESRYDYFNILFEAMKKEEDGTIPRRNGKRCLRRSYFSPEVRRDIRSGNKLLFGESLESFANKDKLPYTFVDTKACFWDKETSRCYTFTVRPCTIEAKEDGSKQVSLPETIENLYNISYKFNTISRAETVYSLNSQFKPLHAGFLKIDMLILDDQPMKYLNIDRDRLREGAIDESELLEVRKKILIYWCSDFCKKDSKMESVELQQGGRFRKIPEVLISLILLFYENVPTEDFCKFVQPYEDFINSMGLVLGKEKIPINFLWDAEKMFETKFESEIECVTAGHNESTKDTVEIMSGTVSHLPRRLVNVESITHRANLQLYHFHLEMFGETTQAINMSREAQLDDYIRVFDSYEDHLDHINYFSIQKKVFKPDQQYPHLLVPCYPHTFQKGRNFQSGLGYCIKWYILSPFEKDTASVVKRGIGNSKNILDELEAKVLSSRQLEKCIRYIIAKRFSESPDKGELEAKIRKEYLAFVENFFTLLWFHRDMFISHFENKRT